MHDELHDSSRPPALPRHAPWRLVAMLAFTAAVGLAAWRSFGRVELLWISAGLAAVLAYMWLGHSLLRRRAALATAAQRDHGERDG